MTIRYAFESGGQASKTYTKALVDGASYSVDSPAIDGFTPDARTVSGVMGDADIEVQVVYFSNTCRIAFEANGGKGKMDVQTVRRNVWTELEKNRFTRSGYTFKRSAKKIKVKAKLTINKKPAKKKVLTLKVKGKTFKARTNSKGIASFTIMKSFLKKPGKYKYTVKYADKKARGTIIVKK